MARGEIVNGAARNIEFDSLIFAKTWQPVCNDYQADDPEILLLPAGLSGVPENDKP
jgi:hypothetical protein